MEPVFWTVATWLLPATLAILMHDFAQLTVASWLGDPLARAARPDRRALRHFDPVGSLFVPVALALAHAPVFGWGRRIELAAGEGAVTRRRIALVALTGPVACVIHAAIGAVLLGAWVAAMGGVMPDRGASGFVAANLFNFVLANACMATFHLLPLTPFDLGRALAQFLPTRLRRGWRIVGRALVLLAVAAVVAVPLLDPEARIGERLAAPAINAITGFVLGLVNLSV